MPRPERFVGPVLGSILLLAAWAGVAHASGSGWVQAVGAVVAGVLLLGLLAPAYAAWRLAAVCVVAPADAVAGSSVSLGVRCSRPTRVTAIEPAGAAVLVDAGEVGSVVVEPARRGVLTGITLRLASAAPLGLLWWSKDVRVDLPRPLHVAPRLAPVPAAGERRDEADEGHARPRPSATGELRGVRPYERRDGRRRVHWRASAHTGELMVRETEQRAERPVVVTADLPADEDLAERRAEEAMGAVVAHLAAGDRVVLETLEVTGRVHAGVTDRTTAGRRLARAVSAGAGGTATPLVGRRSPAAPAVSGRGR